jgi:hypothetical protein
VTFVPRYCDALCAAMVTQFLYRPSCSFRLGVAAVERNCARAGCTSRCGDTRGLCAQQWFGLGDKCTRLSFERSGAVLCADPQHRCAHPSPIVVTYALAVAEPCAWAGARRVARCTGRLRSTLRGQSAAPCAQCCLRMRVKCTRLSIPDATRACSRCANIQTSAVSWLQRKSRHCGDARVIDVLLGLLNCWRWSCERKIPVCPLVGNSVNCQREIFHNQTCGQPTMHICGLGVLRPCERKHS